MGQRYLHLSAEERLVIEKLGSEGASIQAIARHLGRSASTISREVRRGLFSAAAVGTVYKPYRDPRLRSQSVVPDPVYIGSWAQHKAQERAKRSHQPTRMRSDRLVAYCCDKLREGWNRPDEYLDRLARYKQVLSPDFSLYTDRPVVGQIMNTYRNRWCGAYWQRAGLTVIPTVSWSDGRSFDFCFDGVEEGAVVAVATLGVRDLEGPFMRGYRNMMRAIRPSAVVCYDRPFPAMFDLGPVVEVPYTPNARVAERRPPVAPDGR